ncbi:hypothetical protein GCM10022281_00340 [Sphingomonas rosea]|uniref:MobA-like NTP transferase domain-containing protein n=1 Tax=Sphingomonas rosea TaxID=335605 RepID=A0ABP7TFT6_9SPHN
MALGALIAAQGEDDAGGLHALAPLAGRTLIEYQARCAAAIGAAPIVVLVERVPPALQSAFERLRGEGIVVVPVTDAAEAAARFDPQLAVLQIADGVAPVPTLLAELAAEEHRTIVTVPDDEAHQAFERIDDKHRWSGLALVDSGLLVDTVRMLGDWDLQSTLLRRAVQAGAHLKPAPEGLTPFITGSADSGEAFDRHLIASSRSRRRDWPSRFVLPLVEELLTRQLMGAPIRPLWLLWLEIALMLGAGLLFTRGLPLWALGLLVAASPLDRLADRLAAVRLRPLPRPSLALRLLGPVHGLALLGLAWYETNHGGGWGALVSAATAIAFAEAARVERKGRELGPDLWLFSPRGAVFAAIPFAIFGAWSLLTVVLAFYAAASFFIVQQLVHDPERD